MKQKAIQRSLALLLALAVAVGTPLPVWAEDGGDPDEKASVSEAAVSGEKDTPAEAEPAAQEAADDEAAQQEIRGLLEQYRAQTETRTNCETLISAKVGGRAIVLLDADAARVIVERGRLNDQTTLQITEIMQTNAHISPENLTILEVNS